MMFFYVRFTPTMDTGILIQNERRFQGHIYIFQPENTR